MSRIIVKLKSIIKKILGADKFNPTLKNIERIRNSEYFDADYYLNTYADIKKSGSDPAEHYYLYGADEFRNPSELFNTEKFVLRFGKKGVNPLITCLDYMKHHPEYVPPAVKKFTVTDLLYNYFSESRPIKTSVSAPLDKHRLNIIYNGFDRSAFFGGKATALLLAVTYCNNCGVDLRIISQDPDAGIFSEFVKLFDLETNFNVSFFSLNSGRYLEVDSKDDFLCTMWVNADAVLNTPTITGKVFYIMQEVETFFYDHGDMALRAYNTLSNDRIIPIVNSKLLYDYLCSHGYRNVSDNGCFFQPVFSHKLLKASENSFKKKDKYRLFFYGRPGHQRNVFYFGADVLNEALKRGIIDPDKWSISIIGDNTTPKFGFDVDVELEIHGAMSWEEYCSFLSTVDLCYSMIYTPHPSYPPLDAVSSGAVSLTNRYQNKQDLSDFSANIIMADLNTESMLDGLKKAVELAENAELRKTNYENKTHTYGEWTDNFVDVVDFMKNKAEN